MQHKLWRYFLMIRWRSKDHLLPDGHLEITLIKEQHQDHLSRLPHWKSKFSLTSRARVTHLDSSLAPMATSLGLIRKNKKRTFDGPSAVHDAIRDLRDYKSTSTEELSRRATHIRTLAEMAQLMRAVMIRAETGRLSQSALDSTTPPKVRQLAPHGTDEAFEYLRTTLQMMRPVIVKLYVENHSLTKRINAMESELATPGVDNPEFRVESRSAPLMLDQLSSVLGAMGLCDSDLEESEVEPSSPLRSED
jgi:hypothetical protein